MWNMLVYELVQDRQQELRRQADAANLSRAARRAARQAKRRAASAGPVAELGDRRPVAVEHQTLDNVA